MNEVKTLLTDKDLLRRAIEIGRKDEVPDLKELTGFMSTVVSELNKVSWEQNLDWDKVHQDPVLQVLIGNLLEKAGIDKFGSPLREDDPVGDYPDYLNWCEEELKATVTRQGHPLKERDYLDAVMSQGAPNLGAMLHTLARVAPQVVEDWEMRKQEGDPAQHPIVRLYGVQAAWRSKMNDPEASLVLLEQAYQELEDTPGLDL